MAKQASFNLLPALPMLDNATRAAYETYKSGKETLHNRLVELMEHGANNGTECSQISALVLEMVKDGHDDDANAVTKWLEFFSCKRWDKEKARFVTSESKKKARKVEGKPLMDVVAARDIPFWEFKAPKAAKTAYDCDKSIARINDALKAAIIREAKALAKAHGEGLTLDGDVTALVALLLEKANPLNITLDIPETFQPETV